MKIFKRAIWNVIKTYKKTLLMLAVMTIVMTLILSGLALQSSASAATQNAQKSVTAEVTLYPDYGKMMSDLNNTEAKITDEAFANELKRVKYVKSVYVDLSVSASSLYDSETGKEMEETGRDVKKIVEDTDIEGRPMRYRMPTLRVTSLEDIKKNDDFISNRVKLSEGVYPKDSKEKNAVIISEKFREMNNLSIGQTITISGGDGSTDDIDVTIVGIFKVLKNNNQDDQNQMVQSTNFNDVLYSSMETALAVHSPKNNAEAPLQFDKIEVTLNSAQDLAAFIDYFKNNMGDTSMIRLASEQDATFATLDAIKNVGEVSNSLVVVTTVAGAIILALLVLLTLRERKYELGVLLSLGEYKVSLIIQSVLESLCILLVAILISIGGTSVAVDKIQDYMFDNNDSEVMSSPEDVDLDVDVLDTETLFMGSACGMGIIVLSSTLPMIIMLRKDPKTLLLGRD